jgi:hypothetical protein
MIDRGRFLSTPAYVHRTKPGLKPEVVNAAPVIRLELARPAAEP